MNFIAYTDCANGFRAAVDGHLVREVMCFHTWQEAANYTMGADRGENGFHVPQPEKP